MAMSLATDVDSVAVSVSFYKSILILCGTENFI